MAIRPSNRNSRRTPSRKLPSPRPPIRVNTDYDIPYLGGYSIDGSTIYIDRFLPDTLRTSINTNAEIHKYLILHEVTEKALMDGLSFTYNEAHVIAVAAETRYLIADGVPVDEYYGFLLSTLHQDEYLNPERLQCPPPDLDLTPYYEDSLQDIIERMQFLGHVQLPRERGDS